MSTHKNRSHAIISLIEYEGFLIPEGSPFFCCSTLGPLIPPLCFYRRLPTPTLGKEECRSPSRCKERETRPDRNQWVGGVILYLPTAKPDPVYFWILKGPRKPYDHKLSKGESRIDSTSLFCSVYLSGAHPWHWLVGRLEVWLSVVLDGRVWRRSCLLTKLQQSRPAHDNKVRTEYVHSPNCCQESHTVPLFSRLNPS